MTKLLLIDDDRSLLRALEIGLNAKGYDTWSCLTGNDGLTQSVLFNPELILLDLGLPDLDGIDFCVQLRSFSTTPILVLSAAEDEMRKVKALDAGADDYVTKPFSMAELEARIRVALRHAKVENQQELTTMFNVGKVTIDLEKRRVIVNSQPVELTVKEFELLAYLAKNSGKVFTHQQILRDLWGRGYGQETHYLRVYINRLRRKLDDQDGKLIKTNPGVGYQLLAPED